jgi:hypothetical protein
MIDHCRFADAPLGELRFADGETGDDRQVAGDCAELSACKVTTLAWSRTGC